MHSTVCKTNSSITRKLETSTNEINHLSHKLMFFFEDLKSDLNAVKNHIDFKIQSEIMCLPLSPCLKTIRFQRPVQ